MADVPDKVNFGYHLVVYIDLPGQRRELEKIRRVPETDEDKQATINAIAKSAMRVMRIPAIVIAQSGHRDRRFWTS